MRSLTGLSFTLAALTFCSLIPTEVHADPLVINSGYIFSQGLGSSFSTYNFSGPQISVQGSSGDTFISARACSPCSSGAAFTLSPLASFSSGGGTVVLNGTTYSGIYFSGSLHISGPNFTVPVTTSDQFLEITVPFELTGNLIGDTFDPISSQSNIVFSTILTGQGLVTFRYSVSQFNGSTQYNYLSSTFNFQPAPVPEPATLLLLSTGLAGVAARVRKRRRG